MKISQLVEQLNKVKVKHGDVEVTVLDPIAFIDGDIVGVTPFVSLLEDGTAVTEVTLVDYDTAHALQDS
ncbi:MAG: hypothetical protein KW793_04255 [Candidatus Doudnabacteria bacterium]|nr:hypothetical protein [Candidatus Doudnabacteria bacterium]